MIYFHPNALDTLGLGNPARRLLHAMMVVGIELGESASHCLQVEQLLRRAGLPREARPQVRDMLIECTKALALLEPNDDSDDDAPEASCPVFQYVALHHDEVIYRMFLPIYGLSASELQRLLPLEPRELVPLLPTCVTSEGGTFDVLAGSAKGWPGTSPVETSNPNRTSLASGGPDGSELPIDLHVAIRTLWRLAHEDGDLGAEYWNSVINLLKSANSMRSELLELRRHAGVSKA